ncbi:hypothetical protein CEXT_477521 [Caerostris extrusa]|uniref:Uncharacterized protein n=1 Tax=Caerostris extrusa TaxID=172846 RepID=A0AAV4NFJ7_CAEEX|nr:hypothetical protein CEXT_477521 [Caerostris extrusa]
MNWTTKHFGLGVSAIYIFVTISTRDDKWLFKPHQDNFLANELISPPPRHRKDTMRYSNKNPAKYWHTKKKKQATLCTKRGQSTTVSKYPYRSSGAIGTQLARAPAVVNRYPYYLVGQHCGQLLNEFPICGVAGQQIVAGPRSDRLLLVFAQFPLVLDS